MAGKVSPRAAQKVAELNELLNKLQRLHGLVEQHAAIKMGSPDALATAIKRGFTQLKRDLMGAGLDAMAQLAAGMELAAGRGSSVQTKSRILREGVASLRFQLELEQRAVLAEDQKLQAEKQQAGKQAPPADA